MNFRPSIVPVAQAPSVVYAPIYTSPPYPIGDLIGHPTMPQLPTIPNRLNHNSSSPSTEPQEPHHVPSSSHVLGYERARTRHAPSASPRRSQSTGSRVEQSTANPLVHMPMPYPPSEHSNHNSASSMSYYHPSIPPSSGNAPGLNNGYSPAASLPVPSRSNQNSNLSTRSNIRPSFGYTPHPTPSDEQDFHFSRSNTLPSSYSPRIAPSAPIPLAEEEDFSIDDDQRNFGPPPPSYDEVMREINQQRRATSLRVRRS